MVTTWGGFSPLASVPLECSLCLQVSVLDGEEDQSIRDEIGRLVRQGLSKCGVMDSIGRMPNIAYKLCDDCGI